MLPSGLEGKIRNWQVFSVTGDRLFQRTKMEPGFVLVADRRLVSHSELENAANDHQRQE